MPVGPRDLAEMQARLEALQAEAASDPAAAVTKIKNQALAILMLITTSPKPSYQIGDQRINHAEYVKALTEVVTWATVTAPEVAVVDTTPYELETEVF